MTCRCRNVCVCVVTAGPGAGVTGAGTATDPYVVSAGAAALELGCGLTGDGTTAAPLAVAAAAGEEAWPWTCDAADASTLRCDPASGALWSPPEHEYHTDAAIPWEHVPGGFGPIGVQPPTPLSTTGSIGIPLGDDVDCREWTGTGVWWATIDVSYTADASFRLGYLVTPPGGTEEFVPVTGVLDAGGIARREILSGGFPRSTDAPQPPGSPYFVDAHAAVEVLAGQVTLNSWITERSRHYATSADPV